jgi:ATP-dependent DNA helicase PIF1
MALVFDTLADKALAVMHGSTDHLFLTWKAGTGKSTLLTHFLHTTPKNVVVLAPTWVAALNVWGQTIHSFCKFSTTVTVEEAKKSWKKYRDDELMNAIDTMVIDEISMVRADMLDCVDVFLQEARGSDLPFGGMQMIFVGDLYQLPPIVTSTERAYFQHVYPSPYFFDAKLFARPDRQMQYIELETVYRQKDTVFLDILHKIRTKTIQPTELKTLNAQVKKAPSKVPLGSLYLVAKNATAELLNQQELDRLPGDTRTFGANVSGRFEQKNFPTAQQLELKIGSQVMFIANDNVWGQRVNGTLGVVKSIDEEESRVRVQIFGGEEVEVAPHERKVRQYVYNAQKKELSSEAVGSFTQLPLKLCWSTTIHKSQWKTYDHVIFDADGIFEKGQLYVALSRCRTLEGIHLVTPIKMSQAMIDYRVTEFINTYQ